MSARLVHGVGLNDSRNRVSWYSGGKRVTCPIYKTWKNMLERCYYEGYKSKQPSYIGCEVCEEWLTFSNFKAWMEKQDWEGKQLDKDLLGDGKLYSPDTCCFLSRKQNMFLTERTASRGPNPIGSGIVRKSGRYLSLISHNRKIVYLGYYDSPEEAHEAWRVHKLKLISEVFTDCSDQILSAVRARYRDYET